MSCNGKEKAACEDDFSHKLLIYSILKSRFRKRCTQMSKPEINRVSVTVKAVNTHNNTYRKINAEIR